MRANPGVRVVDVRFGESDLLLLQEVAEVLHHLVIGLPVVLDVPVEQVVLGEVEERVVLQQRVLELGVLLRRERDVGRDAAAAEHLAAAIGLFDFLVRIVVLVLEVVVVVVKRNAGVFALDEAARRRVVLRRGESEAGVLGERIDRLDQPLAERGLAGDEAAVVVLNGARHNLGGRRGAAIHQHDQRILLAAVAVRGFVNLFGGGAPAMRNDHRAAAQELIGNVNAFAQQSAGIAAQVEDQAFQVAKLLERLLDFVSRGLVELVDVHVADAGPHDEVDVHAVARDFRALHGELHRMINAVAQDGDVDRGALRSFEQVGHFAHAEVVGGLAVYGDNHVTRAQPGLVSGRADERRHHDDLIVARTDRHPDAVIQPALIFAQQRIGFGIEEVRVRIEHAQHAGNRAVVDRFIGVHRLGVVLLHQVVDLRELAQAVADFHVARSGRAEALAKQGAKKSARKNDNDNQEERTARGASHREQNPVTERLQPATDVARSHAFGDFESSIARAAEGFRSALLD